MNPAESGTILSVSNLCVEFDTYGGIIKAVRGVDFEVQRGRTLGIVGESGCGKSVTVQALMGLIPMPPGRVTSGSVKMNGKELVGLSVRALNQVRGKDIGMIFQDPMTSLNPTMTVGKQIGETLRVHFGYSAKKSMKRAVELLAMVQIPEPEVRAHYYPFQFSGGMRQRVMIAMAQACEPKILIADEPTTALDVTIQAQILRLMKDLQKATEMSIVLITHDLGVIAQMCEDVAVMYAGQIVEYGSVDDIFYRSAHPYTLGLKSAMPENNESQKKNLRPIPGSPPDLFSPPEGCAYFDRCEYAMGICKKSNPALKAVGPGHQSRCWLQHDRAGKVKTEVYRESAQKDISRDTSAKTLSSSNPPQRRLEEARPCF